MINKKLVIFGLFCLFGVIILAYFFANILNHSDYQAYSEEIDQKSQEISKLQVLLADSKESVDAQYSDLTYEKARELSIELAKAKQTIVYLNATLYDLKKDMEKNYKRYYAGGGYSGGGVY